MPSDGSVPVLLIVDACQKAADGETAFHCVDGKDGSECAGDGLRKSERIGAGRARRKHGIGEGRRGELQRLLIVARRGIAASL